MSPLIILFLSAQLVIPVCYGCFRTGHECNPLYLCRCCPKLYYEDETEADSDNVGNFCNMEGAFVVPKKSGEPNPYPVGCCQQCTSEGDGCTSKLSPCCPDQTPVRNASCPARQTSCKRKTTNDTIAKGDYERRNCMLPKCYGENNYCYGTLSECCENMYCKPLHPELRRNPKWGVCTRNKGYTGKLTPKIPDDGVGYKQPVAPRDKECWNYGLTAPPTTPASTTPAMTTPTTAPTSSCATKGMYCDGRSCCKGLTCPTNYLPLYLTREVLNLFGIYKRVCRDYSPFTFYNPATWIDY